MGISTINKNNRLFWLGRYTERVYLGVINVRTVQDFIMDGIPVDISDYCNKLGLYSSTFTSAEDFCTRYAFDRKVPESIICSADAMIGNGMVLRDVLGSQTLSYIQMTVSAIEAASTSHSNGIQLQWALDDIMAFRGSYSEYISSEEVRNTIKSGASIERVSTMLRFESDDISLRKELDKLTHRLKKTHLDYDTDKLAVINAYLSSEEEHPDRFNLLPSVESLFLI